MRSLIITLYSLIMGSLLLLIGTVVYFEADQYTEEASSSYVNYVDVLHLLITEKIKDNPKKHNEILQYWQQYLENEIQIEIIEPQPTDLVKKIHVSDIKIIGNSAVATIVAPLSINSSNVKFLKNKAIRYKIHSSYSDSYMMYIYSSLVAVFIFMAIVISIVAFYIYRYANKVSQVTHAVAKGKFNQRMPSSRIAVLKDLAKDINAMAQDIEDKTQENAILTGSIHHELRIPLTRIRLGLDLALDIGKKKNESTEINELLHDMDTDLEELIELMEQILTISRLSMTSTTIPTHKLSVATTIEHVISKINPKIVAFNYTTDCQLEVNKVLFQRALHNIITNAIKFTQNQVEIELTTKDNKVFVHVDDDGPGIPEEEADLILKPFYRIDKSRNRNTGGFGLGLAISNMVIKSVNGKIDISRSVLGGARISLIWEENKVD